MSRAEPVHSQTAEALAAVHDSTPNNTLHTSHLRDAVTLAVRAYLDELDGHPATDVYPMVLAEIEAPLLAEVMAHSRNNQTRASLMLGLNRGTLRKKLKQYNLISEKD